MVVSWHTTDTVGNPRVMLGTPTSGFGSVVVAETRSYRDAKSNTEVRVNHAHLTNLTPDTDYVYAAVHDGTTPELGTARTAPSGRKPLRFTSFGDQSTPALGRLADGRYVSDNIGSPFAGDITIAIERIAPLFNLINGDLCYANLAQDRIRTWSDWFDNNTRSARYRPWMPAAGNHENEVGNGPIGYDAYQTYFAVPDSGSSPQLRGLWYSFTAGSVRVISLHNDDVCSSYLWRNIMPHLEGLGRLVACDLIGMGASDKLSPSGPDRYSYGEQRDFLFALWDALDLGDHVVLVLHDWGSALGFDWANQHRDRVQGIAFMEAIVTPMTWADWPPAVRGVFQGFRSPQGEPMALEHNIFVERVLPGAILRQLSDEEMNHYRRPFVNGGKDRRPTLSWPRNLPIDGEPAEVVALVNEYRSWLEETDMPKLFINAEPGAIITGRIRDYVRSWPNQTEITVPGVHFVQEDSPEEIGAAIAQFVRRLRSAAGV